MRRTKSTWRENGISCRAIPPDYNDRVTLPGSMLTNGKGNEVTVETKWVSSLYDSSFFFNRTWPNTASRAR